MPDLRLPLLATAAWVGALCPLVLTPPAAAAVLSMAAVVLAVAAWRHRAGGRRGPRVLDTLTCVAMGGVMLLVAGLGSLHVRALSMSPVSELGAQGATAQVWLRITSDPRPRVGDREGVVLRADVERIVARGREWTLSVPVVVLGVDGWEQVRLGQRVRARVRLSAADQDVAALVLPRGDPEVIADPALWWDAAAALRASVREVVAERGEHERHLMPALVDGDDAGLDPALADDFGATGLTHLLAVSGTNLTIVVGALLIVGRWLGVRGRWMWLLGGCGVIGFVLLARTEPSVVRAAAMGSVALIGMGSNGLSRGTRCLGASVLGLLLIDPWLSLSAGFALSVLATAGILLVAPVWRDALCVWAPRWVGEAVSVPLAAQVACTPVVAALSGQVSLVAVLANLMVAPVIAPATVLGLLGGIVGLVWTAAGAVVAAPGAWALTWVVAVARTGAGLATPAISWGSSVVAIAVLTLLCLVFVRVAPGMLRRRGWVVAVTLLMVVSATLRPPSLGWPPPGWVAVMCDVGQGDAVVLRAGPDAAVLVDAGPDPSALRRCLERISVAQVPLIVLTHYHADHVDGLSGVLGDQTPALLAGSPLAQPDAGHAEVVEWYGKEPHILTAGQHTEVGEVRLEVLWPPGAGEPGSAVASSPNDASTVLLAHVAGVRLLLAGDVEPAAQAGLARAVGPLDVDVLKVPHHGSRHQDLDWLTSLDAEVALVGVGADNTYGHPSSEVLSRLVAGGAALGRTDRDGDLAVVRTTSGLRLVARTAFGVRGVGGGD